MIDTFKEVYDLLFRVRSALLLASAHEQSQSAAPQSQIGQTQASAAPAASSPANYSLAQLLNADDQSQQLQQQQKLPDAQECPMSDHQLHGSPSLSQAEAENFSPSPSSPEMPTDEQTEAPPETPARLPPSPSPSLPLASQSQQQPMPVCPDSGEIEPPESLLSFDSLNREADSGSVPADTSPPPPLLDESSSQSQSQAQAQTFPASFEIASQPSPSSLTTITVEAPTGQSIALLEEQRNEIERLRTRCEHNERASQAYVYFTHCCAAAAGCFYFFSLFFILNARSPLVRKFINFLHFYRLLPLVLSLELVFSKR